jgi:hypothetical protein
MNCDLLVFTDCSTYEDDDGVVAKNDCTSVTITDKGFDLKQGRF